MNPQRLLELLQGVAAAEISIDTALERLRQLPFEDLGFARIDHHRALRQGRPEVIFAAGKTPAQVTEIAAALLRQGSNVLCTRAGDDVAQALHRLDAAAEHDPAARTVTVVKQAPPELGSVAVVCAGTSDIPVAQEAAVSAAFFGARVVRLFDVGVAGLQRLLACEAELSAADVVIVVAGMEGALPSVVGGLVGTPVIAVPTSVGYGAHLGGLTPLLAMLGSCAAGVTVVNIDNGFGAAAAADRILRNGRSHD